MSRNQSTTKIVPSTDQPSAKDQALTRIRAARATDPKTYQTFYTPPKLGWIKLCLQGVGQEPRGSFQDFYVTEELSGPKQSLGIPLWNQDLLGDFEDIIASAEDFPVWIHVYFEAHKSGRAIATAIKE